MRFGVHPEWRWLLDAEDRVLASDDGFALVESPSSEGGCVLYASHTRSLKFERTLKRYRPQRLHVWKKDGSNAIALYPFREVTITAGEPMNSLEHVYAGGQWIENLSNSGARFPDRLDVARLPALSRLGCDWADVDAASLTNSNLRRLCLGEYPGADLSELPSIPGLDLLALLQPRQLRSLDGLPTAMSLHELEIAHALRLEEISAIGVFASEASRVEFEACKKLGDVSALAACTDLTKLGLQNDGTIASISFIGEMRELRYFWASGSTNVVDGDLRPLLELPELAELLMMNRRHYRPSVQEVKDTLRIEG